MVLNSMNLELRCTKEEFRVVKQAINKLGFNLKEDNDKIVVLDTISPFLRDYIWKLVEHKRLWLEYLDIMYTRAIQKMENPDED